MKILRSIVLTFCVSTTLTACAKTDVPPSGIHDPNEAANRRIHTFNKKVDTILLSPASNGYGTIIPRPVRTGVSNFADNLSLPNDVINNTLQGNVPQAASSLFRFVLNSTFGVGGLFDPATAAGMERHDTDFGETLHTWGVGEGAYTEMPFFGPSTTRDTYGFAVDVFLDPFFVITGDAPRYIGGVAYVVNKMGERYDYDATVDSILYDSADSYAQARILYLQNRRFRLGTQGEETYVDPEFDPYEDPYADF
ncbi:MAG: VacJ family lipoprotein [Shimia sp.]|uniref:MlaA family lipoprotein n=1 Tax=Shimia sp. TaxID=1954381 RepID=UPI003B8B6144